jgi:hypothetical protein
MAQAALDRPAQDGRRSSARKSDAAHDAFSLLRKGTARRRKQDED